MLSRAKRSAIVVTSSALAMYPMSGILPYSMSKSFSSFLAEGLNIELKEKVDVMSFQPGEVQTKLLGDRKTAVTVQQASKGCLRDLGTTDLTYGAFTHDKQMRMTPRFFLPVFQRILFRYSAQGLKNYRERIIKDNKVE